MKRKQRPSSPAVEAARKAAKPRTPSVCIRLIEYRVDANDTTAMGEIDDVMAALAEYGSADIIDTYIMPGEI